MMLSINTINGGIDGRIRLEKERLEQLTFRDPIHYSEYQGSKVISNGTPIAILDALTNPPEPYVTIGELEISAFINSIIFKFISTQDVFNFLEEKYITSYHNHEEAQSIIVRNLIAKFLKNFIIEKSNEIEDDAKLYDSLTNLIESTFGNETKGMTQTFEQLRKLMFESNKNSSISYTIQDPPPSSSSTSLFETFDEFDINITAQQICLFNKYLFQLIPLSEWESVLWVSDIMASDNIFKIVSFFNRVRTWAINYVFTQTVKLRYKRLLRMLNLVNHLFVLNEHTASVAIIDALRSEDIRNLKLTWEKVREKEPELLETYSENGKFINPKNFSEYRSMISSISEPCVPYIGLIMNDFKEILSTDDILNDTSNNSIHINFLKMQKLHALQENLLHWCRRIYNFPVVPKIYNYFAVHGPPAASEKVETKVHKSASALFSIKKNKNGHKKKDKDKKKKKIYLKKSSNKEEKDDRKLLVQEDMTYDNLPEDIIEYCANVDIPKNLIMDNVKLFWRLAMFHLPDSFSNWKILRREERPWIPDDLINETRSRVSMSNMKQMKKLYKRVRLAGEGAFGCVYCAKDLETKDFVALKVLAHDNPKDQMHNWNEIAILSLMDHPNIIYYDKTFLLSDEVWIFTEYLDGGTLSEATRVHDFSNRHCAYFTREILKGLSYLHQLHLVHRDIKSRNIMVDLKGHVKIIDFGLCASFEEGPRRKLLGSPFWIPPEMIREEDHSYPVDIWSLGIVILELYFKRPPLYQSGLKCMFTVGTVGLQNSIPDELPEDVSDFLRLCLEQDPKKRPSAKGLLKHPWVCVPGLSIGIKKVLESIFLHDALTSFI
eukprot:TRINITY_DN5728_c0_g2_i1.p1 TRINITY_DN5728_c0_g2~~TRINITY_DN5728_c0_g2_i1.p1  ORF type:complete len:832 (-),score=156.20 TRINITY_DN5728_c0_g2_i1:24-2519(-)